MDNIENNSMQETLIEQVEVPTDEEYWQFPTDSLSSFLQLASQFNWRSGRDITAKSVSLCTSSDNTKLVCRATDFDSYLEAMIPLNSSRPITQTLVFPTATLQKCIPQCNKTMVMKKDAFLVMGQWVGIESVSIDPNLFINNDQIEQKGDIHIPSLAAIIPIVSSASVPRDRNIRFYSDSIQTTCLWTELRIPFTSPLQFTLNARQATLLKTLGKDLRIGLTKADIPRIVIQSDEYTLWFLHREPDIGLSQVTIPEWSIKIDYEILSRIVSLSESHPASTGLLQFAYSDNLTITYTSKLSNNSFEIPMELNGSPSSLSPSMVQTKILKMYLKSLDPKGESLNISWDSSSLFFYSSSCTVMLRWEAA